MASQNVDQQSTAVEPKSKKLKLDQSENNINADCPLFRLPDDILAKIIGYVPITQWPDLELVSTKFRDVTHLAWRSLRRVNLDADFKYEPMSNYQDIWRKRFMTSIERVLEKLIERAPFIKSLKGVRFQVIDPNLNTTAVGLLSKFENLEAISFTRLVVRVLRRHSSPVNLAIRSDDFTTFLELTRSRTKLEEIVLEPYVGGDSAVLLDSFARRVKTNLVVDSKIQQRMRLDKLHINNCSYSSESPNAPDWRSVIRLLRKSTLTSLSLGSSVVEPELLSNLIQSAPNLRHLGFAFVWCKEKCNGRRLDAYKHLMITLANHPTVNELRFFDSPYRFKRGETCRMFEAEFLQMMESIGPRLRLLSLDALFDGLFDAHKIADIIISYMPALESVHLHVDLMCSAEDIKNIVRLPNLEEISLDFDEQRMNDDMIATIGQSTQLKSLRLCEPYRGVRPTFAGLATLSTLTKLEIKSAHNIPSDVYVSWGNGFGPTLEELRLTKVSDDAHSGLIDLIQKANRLRVLDLQHSTLTNGILDAVAASCPNLEQVGELIISENNIRAIQNVIDACLKFKELRADYKGF